MVFFALTFIASFLVVIVGIRKQYAALKPKTYLRTIYIAAVVFSLIIGYLEESWYSHGFDIPWWVFTVLSYIICVATAIAFILIVSKNPRTN